MYFNLTSLDTLNYVILDIHTYTHTLFIEWTRKVAGSGDVYYLQEGGKTGHRYAHINIGRETDGHSPSNTKI